MGVCVNKAQRQRDTGFSVRGVIPLCSARANDGGGGAASTVERFSSAVDGGGERWEAAVARRLMEKKKNLNRMGRRRRVEAV